LGDTLDRQQKQVVDTGLEQDSAVDSHIEGRVPFDQPEDEAVQRKASQRDGPAVQPV
jgi:hypothetical protein